MFELADEVRELAQHGRVQVVRNWREVEAGIFFGASFPPARFADWLEGQARRVEAED